MYEYIYLHIFSNCKTKSLIISLIFLRFDVFLITDNMELMKKIYICKMLAKLLFEE